MCGPQPLVTNVPLYTDCTFLVFIKGTSRATPLSDTDTEHDILRVPIRSLVQHSWFQLLVYGDLLRRCLQLAICVKRKSVGSGASPENALAPQPVAPPSQGDIMSYATQRKMASLPREGDVSFSLDSYSKPNTPQNPLEAPQDVSQQFPRARASGTFLTSSTPSTRTLCSIQ